MFLIALLNILALAILGLFAWDLHRRHGSLIQLGILFAVSLSICYPIRIFELLMFPDDSRPSYPGLVNMDVLRELSLLQIPAIAAFCVGYWLWDHRVKEHAMLKCERLPANDGWDFALLAVLYAVSLGAKAVKIFTGNYVSFLIGEHQNLSWANAVENLHMVGWTCLAGAWLLFFRGRVRGPAQLAFFVAITVLELSYQVIQGSKTFLLLPFFIFLLTYYYVKGRIPWKATAGVALFGALVVFPFVGAYRDYFGSKYANEIPSVTEFNAQQAVQDTYRESEGEDKTLKQRLLTMLGRFAGADELYGLRKMVPAVMPFKHGEDFKAVLYVAIPRVIWPNKPIFSPGAAYGEALGTITSVTPFPVGEMYWNFGDVGMVAGMLFWGLLMAACMSLFDRFFRDEAHRFLVVAVFLSEAYWLTTGEGMLAMQIATVIKKVVLLAVLYQGAKVMVWGLGGKQARGSTVSRKAGAGGIP